MSGHPRDARRAGVSRRPPAPAAPYYTFRQCLIDLYGAPLHRVPIDAGFGCPHRGADGLGGCTFCAADGGRARQTQGAVDVAEQVRAGVEFARRRYGATRFMAYVQAFTGTHAPPGEQEALYARILATQPFDAIAIGTRPDCLPEPALERLAALRRRLDVWVELGVQTAHDRTLCRINRGHDWACSRRAIESLAARGLRVAAHLILGLPGETAADMHATAAALAALPVAAVKLHNLHVVRGTALAEEYARAPFPVPNAEAYAALAIGVLRRLPTHVAIMRLCTDTPAQDLVAPRWAIGKPEFLRLLADTMRRAGWRQGDLAAAAEPDAA